MEQNTRKENIFKNKNFTLLFMGVLVSNIAHILFNFAISLYVLRIAYLAYGETNAALIQALYLALAGIILVLFTPFGGSLADQKNKVRIMYITDWIRGLLIVTVAIFIYFQPAIHMILISLFVMNFVLSVNSAFFNPASSSLLRFIIKPEQIQQGTSYLQGSMNLQSIIGIILGGILYASVSIHVIFLINGIGYLASALSEMFIRYEVSHDTREKTTIKDMLIDIKDGLKYIHSQKAIFSIIIMALFINFFISPMFSNGLPYFFEFGLSRESQYLWMSFLKPENWYSIISVSFSVSAIIMSLILSTQKTKASYGKHLKIALTLMVIATSINALNMIGYFTGFLDINFVLIVSVFAMFAAGFISIAFNVPIGTIIQTKVDPRQLGKVSSVMSVLSQALIPFAALVAGILISQISIIALYVFSIVGMIIVNLIYLFNKNANLI
jgi:MFS transporter, DHA3 family, macrolide efflux protein